MVCFPYELPISLRILDWEWYGNITIKGSLKIPRILLILLGCSAGTGRFRRFLSTYPNLSDDPTTSRESLERRYNSQVPEGDNGDSFGG